MGLAQDLLLQADHLSRIDKGKPKQANLRRAVSSAYYALFHLLIDEGAHCVGAKLSATAKSAVARSFDHPTMKTVCFSYAKAASAASLPPKLAKILTLPIEPELKELARIFVELQEQRHLADYDTAEKFNRLDVKTLVQDAKDAFVYWQSIKTGNNANVFLTDLLLRKSWLRS